MRFLCLNDPVDQAVVAAHRADGVDDVRIGPSAKSCRERDFNIRRLSRFGFGEAPPVVALCHGSMESCVILRPAAH